MTKIFISYSRQDEGKPFAIDLRQKLEDEGFEVWHDIKEIEGGRSWWEQIKNALDEVDYMVLVASPAAIKSKVVNDEWHYARQQGVCIYPIFDAQKFEPDFDNMPRWMGKVHFYNFDLESQYNTFLNALKNPCTQPKVPFTVPNLPKHFVERPQKLDALIEHLLDGDLSNPVAITTALQGGGGFGKTTLAIALCHDWRIRNAFDDGILWVTFGENPDLLNM